MLAVGVNIKNQQIRLLDVNGQLFEYSLANNQQDTLLYFFAPWCQICHASIDNLEAIKASNPETLKIVIVALDWRSFEEIEAFLEKHQLTSPVLIGTPEFATQFNITAFPSYYLVGSNGNILARNKGYSSELGMKLSLAINR